MSVPRLAEALGRFLIPCTVALVLLLMLIGGAAHSDEAHLPGAPLSVANRPVFVFRAPAFGLSAQQRAARAAERIGNLPSSRLRSPVEVSSFTHEGTQAYAVMLEGETLFSLLPGDLEPGDPSLEQVTASAARRLHEALLVRWEQGSARQFGISVAWSAFATFILVLVIVALQRVARMVAERTLAVRERASSRPLLDWRRILVSVLAHVIHWIKIAFVLVAVYIWLAFTLTRFPYTQPWGETLGSSMVRLLGRVMLAVLHALPDLATVAVIFLIAHLSVRGLHAMFEAARVRGVTTAALQADTIGATRRLTSALVWVFALVVAYPYLPGSDTDAFKGVSVFFGVLVTLGSSGLVSQVMAGFVLIYSRALRAGDWVQIGESEGYVVDLGALSTKLRTRLDQEITLPNSVVIATRIVNQSDTRKAAGVSLSTSVTIGYDSPWRQVHAMLAMAAKRTPDLLETPEPMVRQIRLQDFYVEYELNVFMRVGAFKFDVLSALHASIQDVFNEYGVQIMSPNFVMQPREPVLVAKDRWRAPPAE
ncbi:mechanosensitive ion channel family protein [Variovorax sp. J2P1-59]|uniref:mechanosensitive ion channel family protein n=1 Tax=Variovorax flavidus TaxID=3053501 RepID=UPI0025781AEB|nr:mechanosensitive ion channel family protein [Variovorax sp. J2P1-59]MDM0074524.1 mechanosensitive ion channel family protein [Variovorax sp. J2P1-59]